MAQGRAKPLLATESGQDVTDKLAGITMQIAVFSPSIEALLKRIIVQLDILIEQKRVESDGI